MKKLKVIVAHPGKQHSFQLATGLNQEGILFRYITTVYDKKNSVLMKTARLFLDGNNKKRSLERYCDHLADEQVVQFCQLRAMITLLLNRLDKSKKAYNAWGMFVADSFGKRVAKYAIRNQVDAVVMYDASATRCFEILEKCAPQIKRILDASAANRPFVKRLYEEDMQKSPLWAETLRNEKRFLWEYSMDRYIQEGQLAHGILAASSFTKRSYTEFGVEEKKICIVPYGVDTSKFSQPLKKEQQFVRFLYVGGVRQMKGISYLLEAFARTHQEYPDAQLEIVGDCNIADDLIGTYKDYVEFSGYLPHDDVIAHYRMADVFVFPSLADGFGLVGTEAMGCGLAMIVSSNSGISDVITEQCGFVIPTGDSNALYEKMRFCCVKQETVRAMGDAARRIAKKYTWEYYYKNVANAVINLCLQ